ncbi:NADH:ubiquinone oxidoreductase, B12 subunit [Phaffia rhodozyma]|uniref:NADH:ubiquinone oxidoreductase, B12 subunit n=1 Tax=Phaffia rhodozyma TaxID=264483 RepID=A0A0F7SEV3_PHARH|nr:NADH:ubiquinone oxidoreductase, B12 subunit [Phaffia rhodozyma]
MRPSPTSFLHREWRNPWERREAWRYQAPFKGGRFLTYTPMLLPTLGVFAVYVAFDELVNHGPLKELEEPSF